MTYMLLGIVIYTREDLKWHKSDKIKIHGLSITGRVNFGYDVSSNTSDFLSLRRCSGLSFPVIAFFAIL